MCIFIDFGGDVSTAAVQRETQSIKQYHMNKLLLLIKVAL